MKIDIRVLDDVAKLFIDGHLDFNRHSDFQAAYRQVLETGGLKEIQVDLGKVAYLDSSALGMLLLLRERAERANIPRVSLANANELVQKALQIANFNRLFHMV